MIREILHSQAKTITVAAFLLFLSALVSRILGMVRDRMLAGHFGVGQDLDIYLAAFLIPDLVYGIFIAGGISAVFIPVFSEYFQKDTKEAWRLVNNVLHLLVAGLLGFCVMLWFGAPVLMRLIAPGFDEEAQELAVFLTRLMLFSPILFGISSLFSGVLQYFQRFFAYSLAPVLYNVGIIAGIVFLVPQFGLVGLALGVIAGAFLHILIQIPSLFISGFHWAPSFQVGHPAVLKMIVLAFPRALATISSHVSMVVMTALASTLSEGSITVFSLASNIQFFPVGLLGVSFAVASFPVLSRAFAEDNRQRFHELFLSVARTIMFFALPVAILAFLLRDSIVALLLQSGKVTPDDVRLMGAALGIFSFGMLVQCIIPFFTRVFFSMQQTRIPTAITITSVACNVAASFLFLWLFSSNAAFTGFFKQALSLPAPADIRVLALPLAFVVSGLVYISLQLLFLRKFVRKELFLSLVKLAIPSLALLAASLGMLQFVGERTHSLSFIQKLLGVAQVSLAGFGAYLVVAYAMGFSEVKSLFTLLRKQFNGTHT